MLSALTIGWNVQRARRPARKAQNAVRSVRAWDGSLFEESQNGYVERHVLVGGLVCMTIRRYG